MFNPSQRFSWRNFISCMVILVLVILFYPIRGSLSYPFVDAHPIIFVILYYGGIGTCFIVGIIWRPNFRRIREEQERKKSE